MSIEKTISSPVITHPDYFLESCVTTLTSALSAEQNGAARLEICADLDSGGLTPDFNLAEKICNSVRIPVRVMIRETSQGFEAGKDVLEKMISSIKEFKKLKIDGFVIGLLKNNKVDRESMLEIIKHTYPFPLTFHKAIDLSSDKWNDIQWINDQKSIDTILTSGSAEQAIDGIDEIIKAKNIFERNIMAAGKIVPEQLPFLHEKLQLKWYHGRSIVRE